MELLDAMRIFVRIADLGSFTRAADSLELPKGAATLAVQRLERETGARLFHRTTRRVDLTPDGEQYLERCRDLLADLDQTQSMFRGPAELEGTLRVDMPLRLARELVIPRLHELLDAHPRLSLQLSSTDRRVDLLQEGFDCVIRAGNAAPTAGLTVQRLGELEMVNCVSPGYRDRFGLPSCLEDLPQHRLVHYAQTFGPHPEGFEYFDGDGYRTVEMPGALTVNNADAYLVACLSGLGIVQLPRYGVSSMLESGELLEILPQHTCEPLGLALITAQRRKPSQRVRVFADWVAKLARPHLH